MAERPLDGPSSEQFLELSFFAYFLRSASRKEIGSLGSGAAAGAASSLGAFTFFTFAIGDGAERPERRINCRAGLLDVFSRIFFSLFEIPLNITLRI
jgi:hypothetical protein